MAKYLKSKPLTEMGPQNSGAQPTKTLRDLELLVKMWKREAVSSNGTWWWCMCLLNRSPRHYFWIGFRTPYVSQPPRPGKVHEACGSYVLLLKYSLHVQWLHLNIIFETHGWLMVHSSCSYLFMLILHYHIWNHWLVIPLTHPSLLVFHYQTLCATWVKSLLAMTIVPLNWLTNWFNQYLGEIRFSLIKAPWFLQISYKSKQPFVLAIGDLPVLSPLPTVIWNFVWRSHTATNARF